MSADHVGDRGWRAAPRRVEVQTLSAGDGDLSQRGHRSLQLVGLGLRKGLGVLRAEGERDAELPLYVVEGDRVAGSEPASPGGSEDGVGAQGAALGGALHTARVEEQTREAGRAVEREALSAPEAARGRADLAHRVVDGAELLRAVESRPVGEARAAAGPVVCRPVR